MNVSRLCIAAIAAALTTAPAMAQVIYNNGRMAADPVPLGTGAVSQSGVAAPAGTQWSEVQNNAGNMTESNTVAGFSIFTNAALTSDFRGADDFTVPAGQTWEITGADFYAYRTGNNITTSPFGQLNFQIWNGRPGDGGSSVVFGDTTTNVLATSTFSNLYRVFNTVVPPPGTAPGTTRPIWENHANVAGLSLPAGTYWIDWGYRMTTDTFTSFTPSVTAVGDRSGGVIGNARQSNLGAWADVIDAGNPATAPDVAQDLPFRLHGRVVPEPTSLALLALGGLLLRRRR